MDRQSCLGRNQDKLVEITGKQPQNAYAAKHRATESEFAESSRQFSVDVGEARPPGVTTESELAESSGEFSVDVGEARPPKKQSSPWNRSWSCRVHSFTRTLMKSAATSRQALALLESQRGIRIFNSTWVFTFSRCRTDNDDDDFERLEWK